MNGQENKAVSAQDFKKMSGKQKLQYMWENHRKHMIAYGIEILVILVLLIFMLTAKGLTLTGVVVNGSESIEQEARAAFTDDLLEGAQLDPDKARINLITGANYVIGDETKADGNYAVLNVIIEEKNKENLDFLTGDAETATVLAYSGFFADLSEVLSEEQLAQYEPYLRYIDQAVIDEMEKMVASDTITDIEIPDCDKLEEMEKPVPVMIDMSGYDAVADIYPEATESIVFAVFENTPMKDVMQRVIRFIMEEKVK